MKAVAKPYQMPPVSVGDQVYYYVDGDETLAPFTGIVTAVNEASVCLATWDKDSFNLSPRDGVRHIADPAWAKLLDRSHGGWDYAPQVKRLLDLEEKVEDLAGKVAVLLKGVDRCAK